MKTKTVRQLAEMTPRQLRRLRRVMSALKGLRPQQISEVLQIANELNGARR
jgi:DNA-binding CsgD family transcriptional regulator